jgi:hypothetical protein
MSFVDKVGANGGSKAAKAVNGKHVVAECLGFGVAEAVSMSVGLGVMAATEPLMPSVVKGASQVMGTVLLPFLEPVENAMDRVCKLEACRRDLSMSREERAERLARTLFLFGVSTAAAISSELLTRRVMNNAMGISMDLRPNAQWWNPLSVSRKEAIIVFSDKGVQMGAMLAANTLAAGTTDTLIRTATDAMTSLGMPKEKAQELSAYTMIWEMPNFLGLLAGLGAIYATHKYPGRLGIRS